jgi:hypothetical protein
MYEEFFGGPGALDSAVLYSPPPVLVDSVWTPQTQSKKKAQSPCGLRVEKQNYYNINYLQNYVAPLLVGEGGARQQQRLWYELPHLPNSHLYSMAWVGCGRVWWLYRQVGEWGTRVVPCQWFALWAGCRIGAVWHGHGCGGLLALALRGPCWCCDHCWWWVLVWAFRGWAMCCVPG